MFRYTLFVCAQVAVLQLMAQVKDTVRENIDYRRGYSSPDIKKRVQTKSIDRIVETSEQGVINRSNVKDTVRENIDYSRSHYSFKNPYKPKRFNHQAGFQVNQLLQLVFNNQLNSNLQNPFGIVYTINSIKTGWGLGLGWGYDMTYQDSTNSTSNEVETGNSYTTFRLGVDKKKLLFRRFIIGAGMDVLYTQYKDITKTFFNGLIDESSLKTTGLGLGARITIQYNIYQSVYLGTEVSYYLRSLNTKSETQFTGLPATVSKSRELDAEFLIPVSLFLMLKFN